MSRLRPWYLVPLFLALACSGGELTAPSRLTPGHGPSLDIADAAHGGTNNPHFYLLPPIVPAPTYSGTFDATQSPAVEICQWMNGACAGAPIARYTMTTGPGSETVRLDLSNQLYIVNWHTDQFPLSATAVYRIRVLVLTTELGHADVQVFASQKAAKNDDTQQSVALVDGTTLPIKFRIEQGAVYLVQPPLPGAPSTTVSAAGGAVTIGVPPGAISQPLAITVQPTTPPAGTSTAGLMAGTVYEFGPTGTAFANPITVTMSYSPAGLPARRSEASLRLVTLVNGHWQVVPGSTVDPATHTVMGALQHFSTYAVQSVRRLAVTGYDGNSGLYHIYLVYQDGTGLQYLTDGRAPSWSPGGTSIAFAGCGDGSQLCVIGPDGSGFRVIPGPVVDGFNRLSWSPDGTQIAYAYAPGVGIWKVAADGQSPPTMLFAAPSGHYAYTPDWSAARNQIAFGGDWEGQGELYLMNSDGSGLVRLTNTASLFEWGPMWTSDGAKLVYAFQSAPNLTNDGPDGLGVLDVATNATTTVINGLYNPIQGGSGDDDLNPMFTPDGLISFYSRGPVGNRTNGSIWTMNLDGTGLTHIIDTELLQNLNSNLSLISIESWEP